MTDPTSGRRLLVDADLRLWIDGVDATLVGHHNVLTLRTDEPARLPAALRRSGLMAAIRQLERRGSVPGLERLTLTLEGPRGRIARIAPDMRGISLRGLPTETRLRIDRPQDLMPASVGWGLFVAGVAIALAIRLIRRRR